MGKKNRRKISKITSKNRDAGNTRSLGIVGPPCRRCGVATEVREHKVIREKELSRPFYYRRWFNCINVLCPTQLIMPADERVFRDAETARAFGCGPGSVGEIWDEPQA